MNVFLVHSYVKTVDHQNIFSGSFYKRFVPSDRAHSKEAGLITGALPGTNYAEGRLGHDKLFHILFKHTNIDFKCDQNKFVEAGRENY